MDNQFYDYMNDTSYKGYLLCGLITEMKKYNSPVWGGDYMNDISVVFYSCVDWLHVDNSQNSPVWVCI